MVKLTLGSLFSGSGGFELAALLCGIVPLWNCEIEPFCIRVTTKQMPFIKHYGDIQSLDGSRLNPVDIITFGSPCQDMSIAGKRTGLEGSRSGLFFEAIRIIQQMREATNGKYPRYIVWENVVGALSSNNGEDFKTVLQQIIQIKKPEKSVPGIKDSRWPNAGRIMENDFSLAWRILDAQYFGVPQRRRRIFLVADFDGSGAGQILFEPEGLRGNFKKSLPQWQTAASSVKDSTGAAGPDLVLNDQGGSRMDISHDVTATLRAQANHPPCVLFSNHAQSSRYAGPKEICPTITATYGMGGNNQSLVMALPKSDEGSAADQIPATIRQPDFISESCSMACGNFADIQIEKAPPLLARDYKQPSIVAYEKSPDYIVRRLTPMECGRLQGFPDWWCSHLETKNPNEKDLQFWKDVFENHSRALGITKKPKTNNQIIKWLQHPHSDSAEYKMWGNGIALPCVIYVLSLLVSFDSQSR